MKRKTINLPLPVLQSSKTFNVNLRTITDSVSVTNGADKRGFVWRQYWTTAQFVTGWVFMRKLRIKFWDSVVYL